MNDNVKKAIDAVESIALEPIKNAVLNRLSNPFFPSVVISWVILNWERVLIILFANVNLLARIERVKSLPSTDVLWGITIPHALTIYYPLVFGVLFVILTPFISYVLFFCHNNVINKLYDSRVKGKAENISSELTLIEAEQKKAYAKEFFDAKYQAEVEDQNTRRRQSQSDRVALIEEEKNIKRSIATQSKELNDLREVLQSSRDELISINKAIKEKQEASVKSEHYGFSPAGNDGYHNDKAKAFEKGYLGDLQLDINNPGWVNGWIVYDGSDFRFNSIYPTEQEAAIKCSVLGKPFTVSFGSHKLNTDEFMIPSTSN